MDEAGTTTASGPATGPTPRGRRRGRRLLRGALGAGLAAALAGGGLAVAAGLEPDPVPPNVAGSHALFLDGAYAGPVHAFSACDERVDYAVDKGTLGSPKRRGASCRIEVGLGMAAPFRQAVTAALAARPTSHDVVIARVANGAIVSGLALRSAYVSDVTLPSMRRVGTVSPGFLQVELVTRSGGLEAADVGRLRLGSLPDLPVETGMPRIAIEGLTEPTVTETGIDPLRFERTDASRDTVDEGMVWEPTTMRMPAPRLRIPNWARATVGELTAWFDGWGAPAGHTLEDRSLRVVYVSRRTGPNAPVLVVDLPDTAPKAWDRIERTDFRRLLDLDVPRQPTVSWTGL